MKAIFRYLILGVLVASALTVVGCGQSEPDVPPERIGRIGDGKHNAPGDTGTEGGGPATTQTADTGP